MREWSGRSKGTLWGYKIFVFCIRKLGIRSAYTLLIFVAAYYFLFLPRTNKHIYYYFRKRLKYSQFQSVICIYKSYFTFGQTIIDKVAIAGGLRNKFTYEFDGIDLLKKALAEKKGGILISAHIGNFEIAEHFFADIDPDMQINTVTTDMERSVIREYLESVSGKTAIKPIYIKDDLSHIFEINNALSDNELICFTGDRYFDGSKQLVGKLLDEEASFPAGPFMIASRMKVPVIFVYVMKEKDLHYHLYAREAVIRHRDNQSLLEAYIHNLESMIAGYPLQWFNYFDFWKKREVSNAK